MNIILLKDFVYFTYYIDRGVFLEFLILYLNKLGGDGGRDKQRERGERDWDFFSILSLPK